MGGGSPQQDLLINTNSKHWFTTSFLPLEQVVGKRCWECAADTDSRHALYGQRSVGQVLDRYWGDAGPPSNRSWRVTRELLHVENHSPVTTPHGEPLTRKVRHMENHSPVNYSIWKTSSRELLHMENHSPVNYSTWRTTHPCTTPSGKSLTRKLLYMENHSPVNYSTWRITHPCTTPSGKSLTRKLLCLENHSPVNYSTWRTTHP